MQIVIDIPEHDKNVIERFVRGDGCEDFPPSIIENLIRAVYFGTPLPKGHGRLIDADKYKRMWVDTFDSCYGDACAKLFKDSVDNALTIIEADKGDKE